MKMQGQSYQLEPEEQDLRQISISRYVQEIEDEQNGAPPPTILPNNSQSPTLFIPNSDGPAIHIHQIQPQQSQQNSQKPHPHHLGPHLQDKKSCPLQQAQQSLPKMTLFHPLLQSAVLKSSKLAPIRENEHEGKRSDEDVIEPPKSMLESKIVHIMKINSMRNAGTQENKEIIASQQQFFNRGQSIFQESRQQFSAIRRNPALQPNLQEVYIRQINDSLEIEVDPSQRQEGNTLRIIPDQEENAIMPSKSQQLKVILSSLVTLSKNQKKSRQSKKQKEEDRSSRQDRQQQRAILQKVQGIQMLIRELHNRHTDMEIEPCPKEGDWSTLQLMSLQQIWQSHLWQMLPSYMLMNKYQQEQLLLDILKFMRCQESVSLERTASGEVMGKLGEECIALIGQGFFFMGRTRKRGGQLGKVRGLEVRPKDYVYSGEYNCQQKSGKGKILYENRTFYSGTWLANLYEGQGQLISASQDRYKGEFSRGVKVGRGQEQFQQGDSYSGQYRDNLFEGQGTYTWAKGSLYAGQFKRGRMHGHGHWKSARGDSYVGGFVANLKEGWGIYRWSNGNFYEGRFSKGVRMNQQQDKQIYRPTKKALKAAQIESKQRRREAPGMRRGESEKDVCRLRRLRSAGQVAAYRHSYRVYFNQ